MDTGKIEILSAKRINIIRQKEHIRIDTHRTHLPKHIL